MKWTKLTSYEKPLGIILFRIEYINFLYTLGCFHENGCVLFGTEPRFFSEKEMIAFNAHWFDPKVLEMPVDPIISEEEEKLNIIRAQNFWRSIHEMD